MTKARLVKEKDMALANGQNEAAAEFEKKLDDLEERAEELDKKRTASISSVAWVNRQNRKKNLEKAEKALQMEAKKRAEEGQNPFSRKKCNPRMVTKTTWAFGVECLNLQPRRFQPFSSAMCLQADGEVCGANMVIPALLFICKL